MGDLSDIVVQRRFRECPTNLDTNKTYVTEALIHHAIETNDYDKLMQAVVIPGVTSQDIHFIDDYWHSKVTKTAINETVRCANFSGLSDPLKLEVKIIGATWLWVVGRRSKLAGIIRNIENLMVCAKVLNSISVRSIFWLDRPPIREAFIAAISKNRGEATIRNYFQVLKDICRLAQVSYAALGYSLNTNMLVYAPERNSNQTYCMPLDVLLSIWQAFIDYFESLNIDPDELKVIVTIIQEYFKIENSFGSAKRNHERWEKHLVEKHDILEKLYHNDNGSTVTKKIVTRRTQEEINQQKNRVFVFNGKEIPNWNIYAEYRIDKEELYRIHGEFCQMAQNTIQSMTGMRLSESKSLTHGSLVIDGTFIGVRAILQKFAVEGGEHEDWAAAPYVTEVFRILSEVSAALFCTGEKELKNLPITANLKKYLSTGEIAPMPTQRQSDWARRFIKSANIRLTREHVEEFFQYNKNIKGLDSLKNEIHEGAYWPLRSHQYRRSLAVHSRRLNLVSNNTLARQFKHMSLTMTEWYTHGHLDENKIRHKIPQSYAKELQQLDLDISAELAMKFQVGSNLIGEGGKTLMDQQQNEPRFRSYPSLQNAKRMAARGKSRVISLGNGFYCMNGTECDFTPVIQSALCNPSCPNMVADADSIPIWLKRYGHYKSLYENAVTVDEVQANVDFLELEMNFYKDALDFYGVEYA